MRSVTSALFVLSLLTYFNMEAQTYLGITANLGNRLEYSPPSQGLERPMSISGSISITIQKRLRNEWALQYGGDLGILGFNLRVLSIDTLSPTKVSSPFLDYSTWYSNLRVLLGKSLTIGKRNLLIGVGGGATYYLNATFVSTYSVSWVDIDQHDKELFYAEINRPENKLVPFANVEAQLELSPLFTVGLGYSHHFKTVLDGTYEFYYTETPSAGKISLYQREFSLKFLIKISKNKRDASAN